MTKQIALFEEEYAPAGPVRPFLKYPGGKSALVPDLLAIMPSRFKAYREPFVGGGALYWALSDRLRRGAHEVQLSDASPDLVVIYQAVQNDVEKVICELSKYRYASEEFYTRRAEDPKTLSTVKAAARSIYLNRCCFNGLWRYNRKGVFNVPFGRYTNPTICDADNLRACSMALQGKVTIGCLDYQEAVSGAMPGDLIYFDPPYAPASKTSNFTAYTAKGFGVKDQEALALVFRGLVGKGVQCMLSNADVEVVRDLYAGFRVDRARVGRAINSDVDRRGAVGEVIVRGGY